MVIKKGPRSSDFYSPMRNVVFQKIRQSLHVHQLRFTQLSEPPHGERSPRSLDAANLLQALSPVSPRSTLPPLAANRVRPSGVGPFVHLPQRKVYTLDAANLGQAVAVTGTLLRFSSTLSLRAPARTRGSWTAWRMLMPGFVEVIPSLHGSFLTSGVDLQVLPRATHLGHCRLRRGPSVARCAASAGALHVSHEGRPSDADEVLRIGRLILRDRGHSLWVNSKRWRSQDRSQDARSNSRLQLFHARQRWKAHGYILEVAAVLQVVNALIPSPDTMRKLLDEWLPKARQRYHHRI